MNDYESYFQKRKENAQESGLPVGGKRLGYDRMGGKRSRGERLSRGGNAGKKKFGAGSFWLMLVVTALAGGGVWLLLGGDETATKLLSRVEISVLGQANASEDSAETGDASTTDSSNDSADKGAKTLEKNLKKSAAKVDSKSFTPEEITLFTKLDERKKQLDAREASLNKLEDELQHQKAGLEKRLVELEEIRAKIAGRLEDRVKVDQQKVDALVSVYQNMKPAQAAKVIETINEDLAVEVLAKMKNKAAAEILNLMDAEKAKHITERFVGFRLPAADAKSN